jgi:hypothetical protein
VVGDFGGTRGGNSRSIVKLAVSTFNMGFGLDRGLMMGDSGLVEALGVSDNIAGVVCWD